ncbi:MAG: hypothetical protein JSV91_06135 [Phycisphaerales bacterium]|nr:MAG: hypothetical protein JSV91_06135 [Phycisphaerales bacterium]
MQRSITAAWTGLALVLLTGQASGGTECDSLAEMEQEVSELRCLVQELRVQRRDTWLTERRSQEIRALVGDVLADADTRASLQSQGVSAGRDRYFFIASADGSFRLNLLGQVQTRYVLSLQDGEGDIDSTRGGFEVSRSRFGFIGHVVDPGWKYVLWAGWTAGGRSVLIDASISRDLGGGWSVQAGQFKLPVWKEWLIFEGFQQFIERSLLNSRYGGLAAQGIAIEYRSDSVYLKAAYSDGGRTWFTEWSEGPAGAAGPLPWQLSNEYALSARAEWLVKGPRGAYSEWESWVDEEPMLALGAAAHVQRGEFGTADDETELIQWSIDASAEFGGVNIFAALIGAHVDTSTADRDEWGLLVQGGWFLNEDWEAIARFEYGDLDGAGTVSDELMILTAGVNRFWSRHALKWSTDLGYAFEPVDSAWSGTGAGWQTDSAGDDGQIVIRSQLQLLF